jgi:threonine/homoserine/homoserine lactone efflux protein
MLAALAVFALALMVVAGSPGPSIAALVARVLTNGVKEVVPFLVAMWIGEAVADPGGG